MQTFTHNHSLSLAPTKYKQFLKCSSKPVRILEWFAILFFTFQVALLSGQNAVLSAMLIDSNRFNREEYDRVFSELAKYNKSLQNKPLNTLDNTVKFKSAYLNNYVGKLIVAKNAMLYTVRQGTVGQSQLPDALKWLLPVSQRSIAIGSLVNQLSSPDSSVVRSLTTHTLNSQQAVSMLDSLAYKLYALKLNSGRAPKQGFNPGKAITVPKNIPTGGLGPELQYLQSSGTGFKLPSQSDVVDAVAIFIANRIKEETVMAFVDQVNTNLGKLQPLPCLFKNTINQLSTTSFYEPARFGELIKRAIAADLAAMPDSILACGVCGENDLKKHRSFTSFFMDLNGGTDLLNNVEYYAGKVGEEDTRFNGALQLFRVVNRYFSFLEDKKATQSWIDPAFIMSESDSVLKLALALVYESEKPLFNRFLKQRYKKDSLDLFLNSTEEFVNFKKDFYNLFSSLHRLDSYWQVNRSGNKSVVEPVTYQQKVADVIENLYVVMNYGKAEFPLNKPVYNLYLKARKAVGNGEVENIVYYSQQMLDALSCFELRLPFFKAPALHYKWHVADSTVFSRLEWCLSEKLATGRGIKPREGRALSAMLNSKEKTSYLMWQLLQNDPFAGKRSAKFNQYKLDFEAQLKSGKPADALGLNKLKRCKFSASDRDIVRDLRQLRKAHFYLQKPDVFPRLDGYFRNTDLRSKLTVNASRKKVSGLLVFFTDVLKAKKSSDLSQVLQEYAEPPQSYKVKRYNNFSIDINSYPGLYGGIETKAGRRLYQNGTKDSLTSRVAGFTAPIGFSFSWAGRRNYKLVDSLRAYPSYINRRGKVKSFRGGSFSATAVLVDIGAVVSYRLSNDASKALPQEVNFSQMLAPGFYLGYGIRNIPLVIHAGGQYVPQLRTFGNTTATNPLDAWRLGINVTYDIPLLNLYHTGK